MIASELLRWHAWLQRERNSSERAYIPENHLARRYALERRLQQVGDRLVHIGPPRNELLCHWYAAKVDDRSDEWRQHPLSYVKNVSLGSVSAHRAIKYPPRPLRLCQSQRREVPAQP